MWGGLQAQFDQGSDFIPLRLSWVCPLQYVGFILRLAFLIVTS